jgi:hypothetical protein
MPSAMIANIKDAERAWIASGAKPIAEHLRNILLCL